MSVDTSAAVLKNELHRLVVETDDPNVLRQIKSIFTLLLKGEDIQGDWWDMISEKEKMLIQRGLQQLDNGERISNRTVREEINQMLGKHTN